jgi:hypothetical protein
LYADGAEAWRPAEPVSQLPAGWCAMSYGRLNMNPRGEFFCYLRWTEWAALLDVHQTPTAAPRHNPPRGPKAPRPPSVDCPGLLLRTSSAWPVCSASISYGHVLCRQERCDTCNMLRFTSLHTYDGSPALTGSVRACLWSPRHRPTLWQLRSFSSTAVAQLHIASRLKHAIQC